jgi:hypothetical protein
MKIKKVVIAFLIVVVLMVVLAAIQKALKEFAGINLSDFAVGWICCYVFIFLSYDDKL